MKFRYKVLIINIVLLSIGICTIGFFMIRRNFKLALDTQIQTSVEENNFIQSSIEYALLDVLNKEASTNKNKLFSEAISRELPVSTAIIYVYYNDTLVYKNVEEDFEFFNELCQEANPGKKQYIIKKEHGSYNSYVSSCNRISQNGEDKYLRIVTKKDITNVYTMKNKQEHYYNILLAIILLLCSVSMYVISIFLTKPLEELNKVSSSFGEGNYDARVNIDSNDEIGILANTYNTMAQSVEDHVNELEGMVVRQDQFVADFTHEMKTPMTAILGYADTLRSKELTRENQIMAASYIFSEGKRLEAMSMKLFDFIYTKNHEITKRPLQAEYIIEMVETSCLPKLSEKNIALKVDCEPTTILGDKDLLISAFINIVDNARKASNEGSEIILSGKITENKYCISIEDFGIGIKEEDVNRICDEFYMVDKSRSRKEGGAGLGLSLANQVFIAHDAEFKIDSEYKKGTTMSVYFSIYDDQLDPESEGIYDEA